MMMDKKSLNEAMAKRRIVSLFGEIDSYGADEAMQQLLALNLESPDKEIRLLINSEGGDAEQGLWLYDAIKMMEAPVTGVVIGQCASTALVILQGCQERIATRHSTFLCHFVRYHALFPVNNGFEEKIRARIKKARESQGYFERILSERTGLSPKRIIKLMREGERYGTFSAERAKEIGFIDEVIERHKDCQEEK